MESSKASQFSYKDLIASLHRENLSTYFILPLLGLPKYKFGNPTFYNSYLSPDGKFIFVVVLDVHLVQSPEVLSNRYLRKSWETSEGYTFCYRTPTKWLHEVQCHMRGAYTLFTDEAKEIIVNHSGLIYNQYDEMGLPMCDPRLLVLTRSPDLHRWLENEFNAIVDTEELLPPPGKSAYLKIDVI